MSNPVRLSISPTPAHVRTVRQVAVAVARVVGLSDEATDEVRLAVGEACTRAVNAHMSRQVTQLVALEFAIFVGQFVVVVRDQADTGSLVARWEQRGADVVDNFAEDFAEDPAAVELAVVARLVPELQIWRTESGGTEVRMAWPLHSRT